MNHPKSSAVIHAALSPRAPAFVDAPALCGAKAPAEPSRSEVLRRQIAAARALCGPATLAH